jgi:hypothetical protein
MAAPVSNINAKKWNLKKSISIFKKAIELSNQKEIFDFGVNGKKEGYKFDFIGEIAAELKVYRELFIYLKDTYKVLERLDRQLHTNIERNCFSNTKKGIIKEGTGIINLKSNYKWKDRVDSTTDDKEIVQHFGGVSFTVFDGSSKV